MILAELFPYFTEIATTFYALMVLTVIVLVLSENRNPVKSMAWVLVLVLLPFLGLLIYIVFGRSLKGTKVISRSHLRELRRLNDFPEAVASEGELSEESRQLISLVNQMVEPHLFECNDITVFTSGQEKLEALLHDIEQARDHIHVQYFIIEDDSTGRRLFDLLERKAREGVKVRMLYDYVGSFYLRPRVLKRLRAAGIDVYPFMELTFTQFLLRINWRNHRKMVIIDGEVGYVGGMNIADRYVTGSRKQAPWRDTHLRLTGEAVVALQYSFAIDWDFTTRELLTTPVKRHVPGSGDGARHLVQMVNSGPTGRWSNISFVFLKAITLAKRTLYIQTPYFLPSDSLLKAMQSAALAGVDVKLMIPRKPDSETVSLATGSYIKECLLAGIEIYFYEPTMMHAKVVIVDDEFVTTGSTNFDFRSFEHNFEFNALIYSKEFNSQMKATFEADLAHCTRLTISKWKQRPLLRKALESIMRLFSPIL